MQQDMFRIDRAVDVIAGDDGMIRFILPQGDFAMKDPVGLVRMVTDRCRTGATSAAFTDHYPEEAVAALLNVLTSRRVLTTADGNDRGDPMRDWIRHFAGAADRGLATLTIKGEGCLAEKLSHNLARTGFSLTVDDDNAATIAVCDQPDLAWLREMNAEAMAAQRPFLPVWMDRACLHLGPMTLPGATGCLECWWHRAQAALRRDDTTFTCLADGQASETLADLGAALVSAELLRWSLGAHIVTDPGMAWRFDLLTMDFAGAKVLRLPRCPVCGNLARGPTGSPAHSSSREWLV